MPGNCPAWLRPSTARLWKTFRAKPNTIPVDGRKCSPSHRNGVRLQNGMLFGFTTEWCSPSQRNRVRLRPDSPISAGVTFLIVFKVIPEWMDRQAYQAIDQEIVPFSVQTLGGTTLHSSEWKGRVVILSFWATWCLPCHAELPEIEEVHNRYRENPNVVILAVDSGTGGDTPDSARAYLDERKLSLSTAIDSADANGKSWGPVATSLGVKSLPALYILDRSGKLRTIHLGYDASEHFTESLSREINRLL